MRAIVATRKAVASLEQARRTYAIRSDNTYILHINAVDKLSLLEVRKREYGICILVLRSAVSAQEEAAGPEVLPYRRLGLCKTYLVIGCTAAMPFRHT